MTNTPDSSQSAALSTHVFDDDEKEVPPSLPVPQDPSPKKLTREECLEAELLWTKMQVIQGQMQAVETAKTQLLKELQKLQADLEAHRAGLSLKYGIDITRQNVLPDGTLVAKT